MDSAASSSLETSSVGSTTQARAMLASYRERVTGVRTHESRHYHSMIAPQESPSALADDLPRLDIQAGGRFSSPNPPLHQHELQHSAGEASKD